MYIYISNRARPTNGDCQTVAICLLMLRTTPQLHRNYTAKTPQLHR